MMKGGVNSSFGRVINNQPEVGRNSVGSSNSKLKEIRPEEFQKTLKQFDLKNIEEDLKPQLASISANPGVRFSNHAVERMMHRGIRFAPEDLEKLNQAVQKAESKGARDTLVLMNDSALIVSVKNKTVVTVMDKTGLKENVFTNIDSTVVI
jgi:flagellar operon protein